MKIPPIVQKAAWRIGGRKLSPALSARIIEQTIGVEDMIKCIRSMVGFIENSNEQTTDRFFELRSHWRRVFARYEEAGKDRSWKKK